MGVVRAYLEPDEFVDAVDGREPEPDADRPDEQQEYVDPMDLGIMGFAQDQVERWIDHRMEHGSPDESDDADEEEAPKKKRKLEHVELEYDREEQDSAVDDQEEEDEDDPNDPEMDWQVERERWMRPVVPAATNRQRHMEQASMAAIERIKCLSKKEALDRKLRVVERVQLEWQRYRIDMAEHNYDFSDFQFFETDKYAKESQRPLEMDQPVQFFAKHFSWQWSDTDGTQLCMVGNLWGSNDSIQVVTHGHNPSFYVRIPKDAKIADVRTWLNQMLRVGYKGWSKRTQETIAKLEEVVVDVQPVTAQEFRNYQARCVEHPDPNNKRQKAVRFENELIHVWRIYLAIPSAVPACRHILLNSGNYEGQFAGSTFRVFDCDVPYYQRWCLDKGLSPCSWLQVNPMHFTIVPKSAMKARLSWCKHEVHARHQEIVALKGPEYDNTFPDDRVLGFDIEVVNQRGQFPRIYERPINMISMYLHRSKDVANGKTVLLFYCPRGKLPPKCPKADKIYVFNSEIGLLKAFARFIQHTDPDVITGFNDAGFDWRWIIKNGGLYFPDYKRLFGRSRTEEVRLDKRVWRQDTQYTVSCPGRYLVDTRKVIKKMILPENPRAYDLNTLAEQILKKRKVDFNVEEMEEKWFSYAGQAELVEYSKTDAYLPPALMIELGMCEQNMQLAHIVNISLQETVNGGNNSKVIGLLRKLAADNRVDGKLVPILFEIKESNLSGTLQQAIIDGIRDGDVEGATVLPPMTGCHYEPELLSEQEWADVIKYYETENKKKVDQGKSNEQEDPPELLRKGANYKIPLFTEGSKPKDDDARRSRLVLTPHGWMRADQAPGIVKWADVASMYPTIFMDRNLCASTLLRALTRDKLQMPQDLYHHVPKYDYTPDRIYYRLREPSQPMFVNKSVKEGLLPRLQRELKAARLEAKGLMATATGWKEQLGALKLLANTVDLPKEITIGKKVYPLDFTDRSLIDTKIAHWKSVHVSQFARQNAIKVVMNAAYGLCLFKASKIYTPEIATAILETGRYIINFARQFLEQEVLPGKTATWSVKDKDGKVIHKKRTWRVTAVVLYGDTDSVAVKFVKSCPLSWKEYSEECADAIEYLNAQYFDHPDLEMPDEKTMLVFMLITGKNYYGIKLDNLDFLSKKIKPKFKVEEKGVRRKKKGTMMLGATVGEKMENVIMHHMDSKAALEMACEGVRMIRRGEITVSDLVIRCNYGNDVMASVCHHMGEEIKAGNAPPKATQDAIYRAYERLPDSAQTKKHNITPGVVYAYEQLVKDPTARFERGSSVMFVKVDAGKNARVRDVVMSVADVLRYDLPPNRQMYEQDFLNIVGKLVEPLFGDHENFCRVVRSRVHDTAIVPHVSFFSATLGTQTLKRRREDVYRQVEDEETKEVSEVWVGERWVTEDPETGVPDADRCVGWMARNEEDETQRKTKRLRQMETVSHFSRVTIAHCVVCAQYISAQQGKIVCDDCEKMHHVQQSRQQCIDQGHMEPGWMLPCHVCARTLPVAVREARRKLAASRQAVDQAWKKCRDCLHNDRLDPLGCTTYACHQNSERLDITKRYYSDWVAVQKLEDMLDIKLADPVLAKRRCMEEHVGDNEQGRKKVQKMDPVLVKELCAERHLADLAVEVSSNRVTPWNGELSW